MRKLIAASVAALLLSSSANAATIFGIDELNNLIRFDSNAPGAMATTTAITGISDSLQAIDFRPLTNMLYGLGSDRVVYTINTSTGAATAVSGPLALGGTEYAFDFNPTIDRLRIVSNTNENYVFNPNDGSLTTATSVFFANGDVNQGVNPDVTAAAYTSSTFGAAGTTTQLYGIDTRNDVLVRQANSAGTLNTVGPLGVNLGSRTSFDIAGSDAFAFNGTSLYRVNLATGGLTSVGTVDRQLFGIAIGAVPEPTTWAMMVIGFGSIGYSLRQRRRKAPLAVA
jgi:hypothetical protein